MTRKHLDSALDDLRARLREVERAILALEPLTKRNPPPRPGRGRKSMGVEERKEVSARLTKYWSDRRTEGASVRQAREGGQS